MSTVRKVKNRRLLILQQAPLLILCLILRHRQVMLHPKLESDGSPDSKSIYNILIDRANE